jgi:hypothetical protein
MNRMDWTPAELGYQPLPIEQSLLEARRYLARLQGTSSEPFIGAGLGTCDDCGQEGGLFKYGRVRVCRRDGTLRRNAAIREAA